MRIHQETPAFRDFVHGVSTRPERMRGDQHEHIRDAHKDRDCLVSAEGFWNPVLTPGENHTCTPFLIFNKKTIETDKVMLTGPSDAEHEVKVHELTQDQTDAYLCMASLREAARFVRELTESCDLHPSRVPIFYSGKRGVHATFDHTLFKMTPSTTNRQLVAFYARQMRYLYKLETLDLEIYKKSHYMLRVVDSVNSETGRFCVQLSLEEALKIDYPTLLVLSSKPRGLIYTPRKDEFTPGGFSDAWGEIDRQYERLDSLSKLRPIKPISKGMLPPQCHDLLNLVTPKNPSQSEAVVIALAAFNKDQGVSKEDSVKNAMGFVAQAVSDEKQRGIIDSIVRSLVDEIYGSDSFHYSCSYIRSLGNDKEVGIRLCDNNKWCAGVNQDDMQVASPPMIPLDKAMNPKWRGNRILVSATLSGITSKPKGAPRTIRVTCPMGVKMCDRCPISSHQGDAVKTISPQDSIILMMICIGEKRRAEELKDWLGIPKKCALHVISTIEEYSTYDLTLIPTIRTTSEVIDDDIPFVSRAAVMIDPGNMEGLRIETAREYVFTVYPWTNPFFPDIILQIVDARPREDSIEQFRITKELHDALKVFQVAEGQSPKDKWLEIYEDLAANVLHIYERFDMFACYHLIYHSLSSNFRFGEDKVDRAYCEVLVISDTGEGKTMLAKRLISHMGAGFFCSGETSKRTGLLYSLHQPLGKEWMIQWGILPLQDKKLCVIDEFSGVDDKDKEALTGVRSSGIVTVAGAATGSAQARTRVVYLTNSPDSKFVNQHSFGCDIIPKVFRRPEDIRRLDIANVLSNSDIDQRVINRMVQDPNKPEHKFTAALCNKLILWAWSRKAEQVEFSDGGKKTVYSAVEYLTDKYSSTLPLLQAKELPNKLARMSAAMAAIVYSTRDGETLYVDTPHVQAVIWLLDLIYSKRSFGYLTKSTISKNARRKTLEHLEEIKRLIRSKFSSNGNLSSFCENLIDTRTFTKKDINEFSGNIDGFDEFFTALKTTKMLEREGQYWVLGEYFKDMLKDVLSDTGWEQGEADEAADANPEPTGAESQETANLFEEAARG